MGLRVKNEAKSYCFASTEQLSSNTTTAKTASFFSYFIHYAIQGKFNTRLVNSALNCTRKSISHESLRD